MRHTVAVVFATYISLRTAIAAGWVYHVVYGAVHHRVSMTRVVVVWDVGVKHDNDVAIWGWYGRGGAAEGDE
jgi:hypothetical protein